MLYVISYVLSHVQLDTSSFRCLDVSHVHQASSQLSHIACILRYYNYTDILYVVVLVAMSQPLLAVLDCIIYMQKEQMPVHVRYVSNNIIMQFMLK